MSDNFYPVKFDYIENPIIGRFYQVPCVQLNTDTSRWVAVLPNFHSDYELNTPDKHFHFDFRFFSKMDKRKLGHSSDDLTTGFIHLPHTFELMTNTRFEVKLLRKKCTSLYTSISPAPAANFRQGSKPRNFYLRHIGASCKGKICPHLGTKMIDCPPNADHQFADKLVCPYHGLIGDKNTMLIDGNVHGIKPDIPNIIEVDNKNFLDHLFPSASNAIDSNGENLK